MSTRNDPLWTLIATAFDSAPNAREGAAAVLRVIADDVVPEALEPAYVQGKPLPAWQHKERMAIRQRLFAEAERAEAGR